uniref:Uncharacterized protein n=1 Tax=Lactuca sativa TaxID=4236 RepID=A0A9R1UMF1_LACSA|nr:hypothetical protein LSAT_V11C800419470 [Lactuca sativa]
MGLGPFGEIPRADRLSRRPSERSGYAVGPKRADQKCRDSESGPGRLKAQCGRTSHTVDSESGPDSKGGPGGLLADAADQSHSRPEVHGCSVIGYDMACYVCMVYVVDDDQNLEYFTQRIAYLSSYMTNKAQLRNREAYNILKNNLIEHI